MKLLDPLVRSRPRDEKRYSFNSWVQDFFTFGGHQYQTGYQTTWGSEKAEPIGSDFVGYVNQLFKSDGVVFAAQMVRVMVFSEARFQFQTLRGGRPADLFGTPALSVLERPWPGGTTGDLLSRMILDADLAGNFYGARLGGQIVRLRPDWVEIVLADRVVPMGPDGELVTVGQGLAGYFYWEGGKTPGRAPAVFAPDEVVHFAPTPDPLATYRGMSWLTPVVREIQADMQATRHKLKFFENAATPNLAVSLPKELTPEQFEAFVDAMDSKHKGTENAYKTLYTGGGADVTVVGADMRQLDFKVTQGAGETRIAAAAGVHPVIIGLSEGMQGSSLNAGNFGAARRRFADGTMRPLWRNAASSLEVLVPPPTGARLWYDDRDIGFLREDEKDAAAIFKEKMLSVEAGVRAGYTPESVVGAVDTEDLTLLAHTGLFSVQMQTPNSGDSAAV